MWATEVGAVFKEPPATKCKSSIRTWAQWCRTRNWTSKTVRSLVGTVSLWWLIERGQVWVSAQATEEYYLIRLPLFTNHRCLCYRIKTLWLPKINNSINKTPPQWPIINWMAALHLNSLINKAYQANFSSSSNSINHRCNSSSSSSSRCKQIKLCNQIKIKLLPTIVKWLSNRITTLQCSCSSSLK